MKNLQQIRDKFNVLNQIYTPSEIDTIFYALAEKFLGQKKSTLRMGLHELNSKLDEKEILFDNALYALQRGEPYQYVLGEAEFFGLRLKVNSQVLIPRPETEELIEWMLQDINDLEKFNGNILDIGTGSGAIALALKAKLPSANVYGIDYREEIIEVAENNARINHLKADFRVMNLFESDFRELPYFDYIISNPPYIPLQEKENMPDVVKKFEPETALFVEDENPTKYYFEISQKAQDILKPKGKVFVEIHQNFAEKVKEIYDFGFSKTELKKDISGNWRMLKASGTYTCG